MIEEWRVIHFGSGLYEVSNMGKVRITLNGEKIELLQKNSKKRRGKYLKVCLIEKEKFYDVFVHTLVARYFVENPLHKKTVDHIDGNKFNNQASNLRWATQLENTLYAVQKNPKNIRKKNLRRLEKRVKQELLWYEMQVQNC